MWLNNNYACFTHNLQDYSSSSPVHKKSALFAINMALKKSAQHLRMLFVKKYFTEFKMRYFMHAIGNVR